MSFDWTGFDRCVLDGDSTAATALLLAASEADRLARFGELTARVRSDPGTWWRRSRHFPRMHALAVIGCAPSAAKAAVLLRHGDMADWTGITVTDFLAIARARHLTWTADLGVRLATRLPAEGVRPREWQFLTALLAEGPADPPVTVGVIRSWARTAFATGADPAAQPHLDLLLPAVFDTDGVGGGLLDSHFSPAVRRLTTEGRLDRARLLAMTVDRLGRPDRPGHLRAFTALHDDLAPSAAEIVAHAVDYARILGSGPPAVAGPAQRALRAADDAGLLDLDTLLEASAAVLPRPEKGLVKTQLAWLDRVARRDPGRAGEVLATVAAGFGHPMLDLQERALAVIERHLPSTGAASVPGLAEATGDLAAFLRPRAEALSQPSPPPEALSQPSLPAAASEEPASSPGSGPAASAGIRPAALVGSGPATSAGDGRTGAPPPAGRLPGEAMPPGIGSAAELAEEVVALLAEDSAVRWERVLDGLVRLHATGDGEALSAALRPVLHRYASTFNRWDQTRPAYLAEAIRTAVGHQPQPRIRRELLAVADAADRLTRPAPSATVPDPPEPRPVPSEPGPDPIDAGPEPPETHPEPSESGPEQAEAGLDPAEAGPEHTSGDLELLGTADGLLTLRLAEIARRIARDPVPFLVATPTHVTGAIDADVLTSRLTRARRDGWAPAAVDFEQALLRVVPSRDPAVRDRATAVGSVHGDRLAAWLAGGGLPDPVSSRFVQAHVTADGSVLARRVVVNLSPGAAQNPGSPPDSGAAQSSSSPPDPGAAQNPGSPPNLGAEQSSSFPPKPGAAQNPLTPLNPGIAQKSFTPPASGAAPGLGAALSPLQAAMSTLTRTATPYQDEYWYSVHHGGILALALPHHREVAAARMLPRFAALTEQDDDTAMLLPVLAEAGGPVGPAVALAVTYGLGARLPAARVAAVDAFLTLAAEAGPFTGLVGAELGDLAADGVVKAVRVAPALAEAHQAGASAAVWEVLRTALPLLLPTSPRGLPELLELGTQVAGASGARGEIPELTPIATRRGGTRLIREARRLHETLTR